MPAVILNISTQKPVVPGQKRLPASRTMCSARVTTRTPAQVVRHTAGEDAKRSTKRCISMTEIIPRPLRQRLMLPPLADLDKKTQPALSSLRAIVVNLERRPDRMDGCTTRLLGRCPGLQFDRFIATDGRVTPIPETEVAMSWHTARNVTYQKQRSMRKGWDDLDTYVERRLPLSGGERGCASSHIRAWRHCLEQAGADDRRPLLVLEDDAAPTATFAATFERVWSILPADCGVLYLGYSQAADWRREVSADLVEAEYVWTTVAYVIWPKAARYLLSQLPINEPVDNWMAGHSATGDVKAYCVRPKIVLQADAWNVNSDVAHSDEHYWGPCSDIRHSDDLYWGTEEMRARDRVPAEVGSALLGNSNDDSDSSSEE